MVCIAQPGSTASFTRSLTPARRAIIRQLAEGERNLSELASPCE